MTRWWATNLPTPHATAMSCSCGCTRRWGVVSLKAVSQLAPGHTANNPTLRADLPHLHLWARETLGCPLLVLGIWSDPGQSPSRLRWAPSTDGFWAECYCHGGLSEYVCAQSYLTLWSHGLQPARLLSPWDSLDKNTGVVAISSSRGSAQPRDQTRVSWVSWIGRRDLSHLNHLGSHRGVGEFSSIASTCTLCVHVYVREQSAPGP